MEFVERGNRGEGKPLRRRGKKERPYGNSGGQGFVTSKGDYVYPGEKGTKKRGGKYE